VRLLVCGAKQRGFQGGWPPWSQDEVREGEAPSDARVGRGKAKLSPSKKPMREPNGLTNPSLSLCGVPQRREKGLGNGVKNLSGSADIPKLSSLFIARQETLTS
jgi:hypothetical protein